VHRVTQQNIDEKYNSLPFCEDLQAAIMADTYFFVEDFYKYF